MSEVGEQRRNGRPDEKSESEGNADERESLCTFLGFGDVRNGRLGHRDVSGRDAIHDPGQIDHPK